MDFRLICCVGALLLAINPALSADIKKWVDQNGQIHFGDYAPYGIDAIPVEPEIITTAPSRHNSLKEIMRPGELRMIKNYEKRGERLIKAKKRELKQARLDGRRTASAKSKCEYHQDKIDSLRRKLREGCTRSEKNRIEKRIARHNRQVEEYCD